MNMNRADKKQVSEKPSKVTISEKVKDYGNNPYFVKKANESKIFLEKHGFPKELLDKR